MKNAVNNFVVLPIGFCFFLVSSCNHTADIPATPALSFQRDVQPILSGNCNESACHSGNDPELFSLVTYNDVIINVNPGNARDSRLYKSVIGESEDLMPPASQSMLTDRQILNLYVWIEQGAINN